MRHERLVLSERINVCFAYVSNSYLVKDLKNGDFHLQLLSEHSTNLHQNLAPFSLTISEYVAKYENSNKYF